MWAVQKPCSVTWRTGEFPLLPTIQSSCNSPSLGENVIIFSPNWNWLVFKIDRKGCSQPFLSLSLGNSGSVVIFLEFLKLQSAHVILLGRDNHDIEVGRARMPEFRTILLSQRQCSRLTSHSCMQPPLTWWQMEEINSPCGQLFQFLKTKKKKTKQMQNSHMLKNGHWQ